MGRGVARWLAIGTAIGLALTGCAAGATGPSPTDPHPFATSTTVAASTTTTVTMEQGLADYRVCLSEQGVTIGEIGIDGRGSPQIAEALSGIDLSDRSVLDALETCGHHLSSGPLDLGSDPELLALVRERLEAFADCVRLEGVVDYPDPTPDFDGAGAPFPVGRIPWGDPGLSRAVSRCNATLRGS